MNVELIAVSFNHTPGVAPALTVRRNRTEAIDVPEWRAPASGAAVACYALDRLTSVQITIRAQFKTYAAGADRLEVRAIPSGAFRTPLSWWPSSVVPALLWPNSASVMYWSSLYHELARFGQSGGPVSTPFGEISPQEVTFHQNGEAAATFTVANTTLNPHGVGVHRVRWRWQFRRRVADAWTDFAFTRFTVYVVLSAPTLPWLQVPNIQLNTQLPWIDVLDVACRWAAGATTAEAAAARVTEAVYNLGRSGIVAYDCAGPDLFSVGTPHYTLLPGFFDCSEFLERLRGGLGNGPFVNCSDCAAVVSTFANALGCDLSQSRMYGPIPFPLNPTRSIGSQYWLSACSIGTYSMHEVAWTGACGENDRVYDACLEVDGDGDPVRAPHTPNLPVDLRFGAPGQGLYRDRLAAPSGRQLCQPQPTTRQRRIVM